VHGDECYASCTVVVVVMCWWLFLLYVTNCLFTGRLSAQYCQVYQAPSSCLRFV